MWYGKWYLGSTTDKKNLSPKPPAQDANRERFSFSHCTFNPAAASGYATKLLAALLSSQSVGLETKLCISRLFSTGMHPTNEAPSNQQKDVAMNFPIPAGNPYRSCEGLYISLYYPPAECLSNNTHLFFRLQFSIFFSFLGIKGLRSWNSLQRASWHTLQTDLKLKAESITR